MVISKKCKTMKEAEDFQFDLYERYWKVELIQSPLFEESGPYVWHVEEEEKHDNAK